MQVMKAQAKEPRPRKPRLKLDYFYGDAARQWIENVRIREALTGKPFPVGGLSNDCQQTPEYLAIARDQVSGQLVGLITASRRITTGEPFLHVEEIRVDSAYDPNVLLRRLLAMMLLHFTGLNGMPAAVTLCRCIDRVAQAFLSFADCFTSAVRYPPDTGDPIRLASAQLAKRVAKVVASSFRYDLAASALRGARVTRVWNGNTAEVYGVSTAVDLAVAHPAIVYDELLLILDLRSEEEAVLIDDARRAYRKP